jgi:hypothetical protein
VASLDGLDERRRTVRELIEADARPWPGTQAE